MMRRRNNRQREEEEAGPSLTEMFKEYMRDKKEHREQLKRIEQEWDEAMKEGFNKILGRQEFEINEVKEEIVMVRDEAIHNNIQKVEEGVKSTMQKVVHRQCEQENKTDALNTIICENKKVIQESKQHFLCYERNKEDDRYDDDKSHLSRVMNTSKKKPNSLEEQGVIKYLSQMDLGKYPGGDNQVMYQEPSTSQNRIGKRPRDRWRVQSPHSTDDNTSMKDMEKGYNLQGVKSGPGVKGNKARFK